MRECLIHTYIHTVHIQWIQNLIKVALGCGMGHKIQNTEYAVQ